MQTALTHMYVRMKNTPSRVPNIHTMCKAVKDFCMTLGVRTRLMQHASAVSVTGVPLPHLNAYIELIGCGQVVCIEEPFAVQRHVGDTLRIDVTEWYCGSIELFVRGNREPTAGPKDEGIETEESIAVFLRKHVHLPSDLQAANVKREAKDRFLEMIKPSVHTAASRALTTWGKGEFAQHLLKEVATENFVRCFAEYLERNRFTTALPSHSEFRYASALTHRQFKDHFLKEQNFDEVAKWLAREWETGTKESQLTVDEMQHILREHYEVVQDVSRGIRVPTQRDQVPYRAGRAEGQVVSRHCADEPMLPHLIDPTT
jgi:hypothetical protein